MNHRFARRFSAFLVTLLVTLIATTTASGQGAGGFPALVRTAEARMETMAATQFSPGTVVSMDDARIAAEVAGRLIEVSDIGAEFAAGEVEARLENTNLRLRVAELEAQIEAEAARLEFLQSEEARLKRLAEQNNAAANALDQTRADRRVAASNLAIARARLDQLDDQLYRTAIRAPFDGVLVERLARAGEHVTVGDAVVRMVNPQRLEVVARAPLEFLADQTIGDRVSLRLGEDVVAGTVRALVAVGDENTHVFEARIDVPANRFAVGQTVRVELPASASREVLSVPRDALVLRADGIAVFVVDAEGKAARRMVRTGLAAGDRIEVIGDLTAGERVVIRGNERLRAGQQVVEEGAAASAGAPRDASPGAASGG